MAINHGLLSQAWGIRRKSFEIRIEIPSPSITSNAILRLYTILNTYENLYFIIIKSLPFCLMPDAIEHLEYVKNKAAIYRRIAACLNCSISKQCPGWDTRIPLNAEASRPIKDLPQEIVIETTSLCNLNCKTCFINKMKQIQLNFLTARKIIDETKSLEIPAVRFTGGEPLLNPQIFRMLEYAKTRNLYILLNTNATVINRPQFKLLSNTVDNILVSLQGFNQKSNRRLTASEAIFSNKIKNIILLKSKIPVVRIGTIISKTLLSHFKEYSALIKRIGIDTWELYRPIQNSPQEEFCIEKKDFCWLITKILDLKETGLNVKVANPLPFCIYPDLTYAASATLGAIADDGNSRIVWDLRGYFKPSYFIDEVLGTTINEAWGNPLLKRLKETRYLPAACRRCVYLKWCKGGSRAMAKLNTNTYFAPDPLISPSNSFKNKSFPENQS